MWKALMPGLVLIASAASASPFEGPRAKPCTDCRRVRTIPIPKAARRVFRAIEVRSTAEYGDLPSKFKWNTAYWLAVRTSKGWWVQFLGESGLICGFDHAVSVDYQLPAFKVGPSSITFDGKTCRFDRDTPTCE